MRSLLTASMVVLLSLALYAATLIFAGVTPDLAAPAYALIIFLLVLWAGKLFFAETVSWKSSPIHLAVLGFLIYAFVRYLLSPLEYESRRDLIEISFAALVYFVAASNLYRARERSLFIWALLALAVFEGLSGIWQFATKSPTIFGFERPTEYSFRAGGTFICPNHLAGFLEIALGLFVARLVLFRTSSLTVQQIAIRKIVLGYGALISLVALIVTLSRGGWIAAAVGLASLTLWGGWEFRAAGVRIASVLLGLALLTGLAYGLPTVRNYVTLTFSPHEQKGDGLSLRDDSLGGRKLLWASTARIIRDHPLFGTGGKTWEWYHAKYRDPKIQTHPQFAHNDILQFTSDYGLAGAAFLGAIIVFFFHHVRAITLNHRPAEERSFAIGAAMALTSIVVHSWFDFNMHIQANTLLLAAVVGLTAGMESDAEASQRAPLSRGFRYALGTALILVCATAVWFVTPSTLAARYNNLGDEAKEDARFDEAEVYYKKAMVYDSRNWEPYTRLADVYRTRAQWTDRTNPERSKQLAQTAMGYYQQGASRNPLNPDIPAAMGRCYELLGDQPKARMAYQQALDMDPNNGFVVACMATFHRNQGENEQAFALYKRSWLLNAFTGKMAWYNMEDLKEAVGEK